nr:hypothetical protein [uncultured Blautia sp.]
MGDEFDEGAEFSSDTGGEVDFSSDIDSDTDFIEDIDDIGENFEISNELENADTEDFPDDIGEDISDESIEDTFESSEYENDFGDEILEDTEEFETNWNDTELHDEISEDVVKTADLPETTELTVDDLSENEMETEGYFNNKDIIDTEEISEDTEELDTFVDDHIIDEEIPEDIINEKELADKDEQIVDDTTENAEETAESINDNDMNIEKSQTPMQALSSYMNEHNYGPDDFEEYSQDPEWQKLHREVFPDWEENSEILETEDELKDTEQTEMDSVNEEIEEEISQAYEGKENLGQELLDRFGTKQVQNGSDYFVKGDNYDQFENDYYSADESEYISYDTPIERDISPSQIEGIHLGQQEVENPDIFWEQHESGGTAESFQEIAGHIPEVREQLEAGVTLDDLEDNPTLAECAGIYFRNKPEVTERNGYYEFNGNGRHRIMAARSLGIDIPVRIVGKRS